MTEVVEAAREYFNDPTITGIPLENSGGPGSEDSHWDKEFFTQELMNPTEAFPSIMSIFTVKLFEGTGWYKVRFSL